MAIPLIAAMAALGLAKGISDRGKANADRRQAAEMARWSPWTGMGPNQIRQADELGSTMQGGMAGAMMGGGSMGGEAAAAEAGAPAAANQVPMASAANAAPAAKGVTGSYNTWTSPWNSMAPYPYAGPLR